MLRPILTAFRTLTIIPLPGKDAVRFSHSLVFFPVVGLVLGLVVVAGYQGCIAISFSQWYIAAIVLLAIVSWITGGLHLDGFADVCDAFGGARSRGRVLEIMKDSRVGTFGAAAIAFDLLIKVFCWAYFLKSGRPSIIVFSLVLSRAVQPIFISFFPNAKGLDSSIAAIFRNDGAFGKVASTIVLVLVTFFMTMVDQRPQVLFYVLASLSAVMIFGLYCLKRIGGITGDCIGAVNEITEMVILVLAAIL